MRSSSRCDCLHYHDFAARRRGSLRNLTRNLSLHPLRDFRRRHGLLHGSIRHPWVRRDVQCVLSDVTKIPNKFQLSWRIGLTSIRRNLKSNIIHRHIANVRLFPVLVQSSETKLTMVLFSSHRTVLHKVENDIWWVVRGPMGCGLHDPAWHRIPRQGLAVASSCSYRSGSSVASGLLVSGCCSFRKIICIQYGIPFIRPSFSLCFLWPYKTHIWFWQLVSLFINPTLS